MVSIESCLLLSQILGLVKEIGYKFNLYKILLEFCISIGTGGRNEIHSRNVSSHQFNMNFDDPFSGISEMDFS